MEERIPWWQPGEKKSACDGLWKSRFVEKSTKRTFPLRLEIRTPRGFPLYAQPGDYGRLTKIEHSLLRKGDISNVLNKGTFLLSVDTAKTLMSRDFDNVPMRRH